MDAIGSWIPGVQRKQKHWTTLGFPPLFSTTSSDVDPVVMNGIATTTSNHDFFLQTDNGYLMGHVKPLEYDDYKAIYNL